MQAINLKTEYLYNPIGIDVVRPWLFWNCKDGIRQNAYQVVCSDDCESVLLYAGGL